MPCTIPLSIDMGANLTISVVLLHLWLLLAALLFLRLRCMKCMQRKSTARAASEVAGDASGEAGGELSADAEEVKNVTDA